MNFYICTRFRSFFPTYNYLYFTYILLNFSDLHAKIKSLCFQGAYNTGDLVKINEDREQHIGIIQKVIKDPAGRSRQPVFSS